MDPEVEVNTETEAIIKSALEEQQYEKRARKEGQSKKTKTKGLTDVEIEAAEGGTVRENMVALAQRERKKRQRTFGDTEFVEDVEQIEEGLEEEEDEGVALEPFNLSRERQEGYFDEGGHYVEHKRETDDENDAWLASEEAAVVSAEVRAKVEAENRRRLAAEDAPEMTGAQMAAVKRRLANILLPGETVTRALKRLRPLPASGPKGKRAKKVEPKAAETEEELRARAQFEEATEAASLLMDAGELDVYSLQRADFEAAAALYEPKVVPAADAGDDDEDMFADDAPEEAAPSKAPAEEPAEKLVEGEGPSGNAPPEGGSAVVVNGTEADVAAAGPGTDSSRENTEGGRPSAEVDFSTWSIKDLRRYLEERGIDESGAVEKEELVAKAREAAAAGTGVAISPEGYDFDPASGYYFSAAANMYWDAASGGFYSGETGLWYSYDAASQQFVQWPSTDGVQGKPAEPAGPEQEAAAPADKG